MLAAQPRAPAPTASVEEPSAPAPSTSASASASVGALAPSTSSTSAPIAFAAEPPSPTLGVQTVGLHIGGGRNDEVTKEPILASVAPHLETMKRCWPWVDARERKHAGDFGVDLVIEAEGGRARVMNPRGVKSAPFQQCMIAVFSAIEFLRPKTGKTQASYALRFTP